MTTSTPLKWHGGKSYLASKIIELMPEHTHYMEPFFGGGQVLFRKPFEGISEAVNDINAELTNFWVVLQTRFKEFQSTVEFIPLSQMEFSDSLKPNPPQFDMLDAIDFFVRYRQSRQGLGKDYCTPTKRTRRGMNENVSAWLSAVDGLPEAHERLRRVEIRNMDAIDFIKKYDHTDALFYCDPPYLSETRSSNGEYGEHEMDVADHGDLLRCLSDIDGKFLLSGYRSDLYDDWASSCNWRRVDFKIDNKASSQKNEA